MTIHSDKYAASNIQRIVTENGYRSLDHHDCSICGYMVHYSFGEAGVLFHPGCNCGTWSSPRQSSFQAISDWLAMQDSDKSRDRILDGFRF